MIIKETQFYAVVQELKYENECSYLMEGYTCSQCGVITRPCLVEKEIMRKLCENYTPVPV